MMKWPAGSIDCDGINLCEDCAYGTDDNDCLWNELRKYARNRMKQESD